jgi:hypothetical protein
MAGQSVLLGSATIFFPKQMIQKNCETFQDNPDLLKSRSYIRWAVCEELLRTFLPALDGSAPKLTTANMNDRSLFCEKFGCSMQLSTTNPVSGFTGLKSKPTRKSSTWFTAKGNIGFAGVSFAFRCRKCLTWAAEQNA